MENSTEQDILVIEMNPSAPNQANVASYNQTNPENSQTPDQKAFEENEAAAADLEIPDPPQHSLIRSDVDEPMLTSETPQEPLEKMTLEQKKELLNKFDHLSLIKVGTYVDATDSTNNFLFAKVVEIDGHQALVNFDGWSQKWNLWHRLGKICAFRSRNKGYTGQKKVALRNHYEFSLEELERQYTKVIQFTSADFEGLSAHETTQYLSGELFIYVDCILGDTFPDKSVLTKVETFIKAVLRLIVAWLVKLPQLNSTFEEMEALPQLFLVDPKAAIIESCFELMETLGKLFNNCFRAGHFFTFYDSNQVPPHVIKSEVQRSCAGVIPNSFGVVVQDLTNIDFESRTDDGTATAQIIVNRKDLQYGSVLNWVQYFAQIGGFDAVLNIFEMGINEEKKAKAPFYLIGQITKPFKCLGQMLNLEFAKIFCTRISNAILKRLSTLSEQDVKVCNKDQVESMMNDLNQVLTLGMITLERSKFIELTELSIGLRFLKSNYLEKRIKGLQDIRYMIDRVLQSQRQATYNKRFVNNWSTQNMFNNDNDDNKIQPSVFLNTELMIQWLQQNKILDVIFGQGAHLEIVKRSQPILEFIARQSQGSLDESIVELMWRCQDGKHEEMIRTVYSLIENVLPFVSLEVVNLYFAKVSQEFRIDEKYLLFLKKFTLIALDKQYQRLEAAWQAQADEMSEPSDYSYNFDNFLNSQETKLIENIEKTITFETVFQNSQYGIPIFWRICLDDSQQTNETRELALKSMLEFFKYNFRKTNRLQYLIVALQQLLQQKSIVQSSKVIKAVIQSYNIDQEQRTQYPDDEPQLIQVLQMKIQYLDKVVELLANYHELVKQKMKTIDTVQAFEETQQPSDEKLVFTGYFSHECTLKTLLNQIKFLVSNPNVSLGVENIKLLWRIFVDEPNYAKEQVMFLNWINRSRTENMQNNIQKRYYEMFTKEEKKFIFLQILCPEVTKPGANLNLAKCFNTYFIQINKADGAIKNSTKRFRVLNFSQLQGLNALWEISLNSQNQKARDLCQDLLVNLYLKLQEPDSGLLKTFVDNCMTDVSREGIVSLLSLLFDRYEGIKDVKIESEMARKFTGIKPLSISVTSWMDSDQPQVKIVPLTYYQSLGAFRQNIASTFGLHQNEFVLLLKNQHIVDPEVDDDKQMKDFAGMFTNVSIRRNTNYDPTQHPKYLISENQEYFQRIFGMLKTSAVSKLDSLYDLFVKLPVNKALRQQFVTLKQVREADSEEGRNKAWSDLLDPTSMFGLLYCVQIINGLINQQEQDNIWLENFISFGGFHQLIKCLIQLNVTEVDSMLKLKCLKDLIGLIQLLLQDRVQFLQQVPRAELMNKLLDYIEMICDFSIRSEQLRGYSYEILIKRIEAARIRKQNNKLHQLSNKNDKKYIEEDDGDSEDKTMQTALLREFKDCAEVVSNMFTVLRLVSFIDPDTSIDVLGSQHQMSNLLSKGLLQTENLVLRNCIGCRVFELLHPTSKFSNEKLLRGTNHKLQILKDELSHVKKAVQYERRCFDFYKHLSQLVSSSGEEIFNLQQLTNPVMNYLSELIMSREIKERNTQETDELLQGSLMLLASLLQKFPQQKSVIGNQLLKYLIHDCLFEIPQGNKGNQNQCAPKCKSLNTRTQALNLVQVLSRDCLENLQHVLSYLSHFNQEATWRTMKESDWSIKLYNDEKSSTGHVGIKNLACICYMNSLNQQLFMIPTFRNDILSIQDPNHENNADEDNMFLQWQTLFTGLLLSEKMYINPKGFCHAFKDWDGNPTNVVEQMDVEEYLNMLFDRLENAIKGTPQAKTIQYHFGGELANEIICKTCPHQYERKETFLTIGISVKNKKSIIEGLDAFVQGDILDENNQYQCEKCDKKVDALKRSCIKKLPRYLITTLKRFEFDLDQMIRIKVNEFYEFPQDLDMTKYTQEYLTKKAKGGEFNMKYQSDYYNYELVGIVVHLGTADSGHYYSYIKEQERFAEASNEQWYEFNDTLVRDFDKNEIPSECFGGVEPSVGWGVKGYVKTASAYIVVYKRKMESEPLDSDDETAEVVASKKTEILGQKKLDLNSESPIIKKIAKQNHKYWQNRFLFSPEYTEFVCQLTVNWNTNFVIPANSLNRNDDSHLYDLMGTLKSPIELRPMMINPVNDVRLSLDQLYSKEKITEQQFNVFKFAASHYINVMQRAEDKAHFPTMVKYLKSYMNFNAIWAKWFLQQFVNPEIIKECFFENSNKLMRQILVGIIYCAMLKAYELERTQLNNYWKDLKSRSKVTQQTILGNLILLILSMLPQLKNFNKNHSSILQILARFSSLGQEARVFMIEAQAIEKLLNYFYWDCSPYLEEFKNAPRLPFEINLRPEIGLPTPESTNEKKGTFAVLKRTLRFKKFVTDDPHFTFLVETIGNLARALKNTAGIPTKFMLDQTNLVLGEHDQVLFLPSHEFLEKMFYHAKHPRIVSTLCKAYMHFAIKDETVAQKLWETVTYGLKEYEHNKSKPYFILFQFLIEFKSDSKFLEQNVEVLLTEFFSKVIFQNSRYFQWMEVALDFVWKIYTRIPFVRLWMQQHVEVWEFLGEWLDRNKEPPLHYPNSGVQQTVKMNKGRNGILNSQRYNKNQNQVFYYYRQTCINQMKNKQNVDLSHEIDLDLICVQDFKFIQGMKIDILENKFVPSFTPAVVNTDLDEILQVKSYQEDSQQEIINWYLTQKCKFYYHGLLQSLYKFKEIHKIQEILQRRMEQEAQNRIRLEQEQQAQSRATPTYSVVSNGQETRKNQINEDDVDAEDEEMRENLGELNSKKNSGLDFYNDEKFDSTDQNVDENDEIEDFENNSD